MKTIYPDFYRVTKMGDGLVKYEDNGMIYYRQDGKDMTECKRCGELDFEDKMSWDDLCTNCQEHDRICYYCGGVFPEALAKDDDGYRVCPDCMAINAALDNLPPAQTMKEAG